MKRLMYSSDVTWEEYLLCCDENDIEATLLNCLADQPQDDLSLREIAEHRLALQTIDRTKISGDYEQCRQAALVKVRAATEQSMLAFEKANPGIGKRFEEWEADADKLAENGRHLSNLFAGKKSPDPAQAARFHRIYDELDMGKKTYADVEAILPMLERAKVTKRKPSLPTPWTNEIHHMDAMRLLIAAGKTIAQAAKQRADEEGRAGAVERAKTLAKLYRKRVKLRN